MGRLSNMGIWSVDLAFRYVELQRSRIYQSELWLFWFQVLFNLVKVLKGTEKYLCASFPALEQSIFFLSKQTS